MDGEAVEEAIKVYKNSGKTATELIDKANAAHQNYMHT